MHEIPPRLPLLDALRGFAVFTNISGDEIFPMITLLTSIGDAALLSLLSVTRIMSETPPLAEPGLDGHRDRTPELTSYVKLWILLFISSI